MHFDLEEIIKQINYIGLFGVVFAESGLLFGFFLPGDSLLFTTGFLASQGFFDIQTLLLILSVAAITGDSTGYWFGKKTGSKIFNREDSLIFHKKNLVSAHNFYEKHGGKTIILARFLPAVRTFAPIIAGAADMKYSTFIFYNVIGGIGWVFSMLLGGYFLGKSVPNIDKYMIPIVGGIIIVSSLPTLWHLFKDKGQRDEILNLAKKLANKLFHNKNNTDSK